MMRYIVGTKFSAFFLLACGAVVRQGEALTGLQDMVKRYFNQLHTRYHLPNWFSRLRFTDTFAFGAERLISHQVGTWMISYADQVIVSGQPSKDAIGNLLYSSGVGKYTSIVYLNGTIGTGGKQTLKLSQYIWEHRLQQPNTHPFPIACPTCHHVYSWRSISSHLAGDGAAFNLKCTTKLANGEKCAGTWRVPELPSSSAVPSPYVGTWRVM